MHYLGKLSDIDPMFSYLRDEILHIAGDIWQSPVFDVFGLEGSNHVCLYEERHTRQRVVGKYFCSIERSFEESERRMEREFKSLEYLRGLGFNGYPHYVARPLGRNAGIGCVLVAEYCYGAPLSHFIKRAIRNGDRESLFRKLTSLAFFFARLHNDTADCNNVDFGIECQYFESIIRQHVRAGFLNHEGQNEFLHLLHCWKENSFVWEDRKVLVHGDATPANFLFGDDPWVIVIDLERMRHADRMFDVGRLAGELKHFFMKYAGNADAAEPFIGHFLWEYSCHFPDRDRAFSAICRRIPFYMGLTLLRISRNSWISGDYRNMLFNEARNILKGR